MRRRDFITLVGGVASWPLAARAQQAGKIYKVALFYGGTLSLGLPILIETLRQLGWIEGKNISLEQWHADNRPDRLPVIASEIVQSKVDVVVASATLPTLAIKQATTTIPIVMTGSADAPGSGLVASLARPGGNVTGLTLMVPDTASKRVALLREVIPGLRRVAIFGNFINPSVVLEQDAAEAAAHALGLRTVQVDCRRAEDITAAIELLKGSVDAIYVADDPFASSNRVLINKSALVARLPTIRVFAENLEGGGLISYGPDIPDLYRRAAQIVDKILRGASPSDIPVEQPTKFDLVINLKTAKALGLTIPHNLLVLADEVIE
jgi:putative tryptophan/tyrosine transport system substrate-binding protein